MEQAVEALGRRTPDFGQSGPDHGDTHSAAPSNPSRSDEADGFHLPPGAEYYVALQRTAYQHPVGRWFRRLGLGKRYDAVLLPLVERRRRPQIARRYRDEMQSDFDALRPHLPETAGRILDIGCGMAGIEVFLASHYRKPGGNPEVHLLDRTAVSEVHYGFEPEAAFYNSLEVARAFLAGNGIPEGQVFCHDVERDGFPDGTFDLVISLISWGFHYPVHTYLDRVRAALAPDGCLILDVRKGLDGLPLLETRFSRVTPIGNWPKYTRVLARP